MEYRQIGNSDLRVSEVGFGTWGISGDFSEVKDKEMIDLLRKSLDLGINFFDTCLLYTSRCV